MPLLLALVLAAAPPAPPSPALRLEGLDRLYFVRVSAAGHLTVPPDVSTLLPLVTRRAAAPAPDPASPDDVSVHDVALPLPEWPRPVVVRQVSVPGARIDELWLALYDGGRRRDVWHFQARPDLTEGKLLANYRVGGARAAGGGAVVLDLDGSMYRPQGGWWVQGKEVTLALRGDALVFQHVRNAYGYIHAYDRDADPDAPALTVTFEHEVDGRFERRELSPAPVAAIKACGADVEDDQIGPGSADLETVADCVTRDPRSTVTVRRLDEPSFAERGYKEKHD